LAALYAGLHGLALLCAYVSLDGYPLVIVSLATAFSAVHAMAQALLLWPDSLKWLEWSADGSAWWGQRRDKEPHHAGSIGRQAVVWPGLVILSLDEPARRRWLVLDPASAKAESLRPLRLWLRLRREEKVRVAVE
jgi:hypothetical protein